MNQDQFISKYSDAWRQLENLTASIEKKGLKNLGSTQAQEFLHLFRQTSHHLAYVKTQYPKSDLFQYLNNLIAKCQGYTYGVKKESAKTFWNFLAHGYPQLIREHMSLILLAFAIFMLGAVVAGALVASNPDNASLFLPKGMTEAIQSGKAGSKAIEANYPLMSSTIMTNNIRVSLGAFVLGLTLGLGTIYILFFNGALIGALTTLIYMYGHPLEYWSLIFPHGFLELTAIFISGAAGFLLAKGLLMPGELTRSHSLIYQSKKAISMMLGVIVMLVIAGIIEGFLTPQPISPYFKLTFAGFSLIAIIIYIYAPWSKGPQRNPRS